jgi:hypothetical protein
MKRAWYDPEIQDWGAQISSDSLFQVENNGRRLYYSVHADRAPRGAPVLLLLHSLHAFPREYPGIAEAASKMIVVQPWDHFGFEQHGSWWLGEDGEFFMLGLIDALIAKVRSRYPASRGLYTAGSSMGGFGALLHGLRLCADGIYSEVPTINLFEAFGDSPPFIEAVFGSGGERAMGDLIAQFGAAARLPGRINLVHNRWELSRENDLRFRHSMAFVDLLVERGADFYLEVPPTIGHSYIYPLDVIAELLLAERPA